MCKCKYERSTHVRRSNVIQGFCVVSQEFEKLGSYNFCICRSQSIRKFPMNTLTLFPVSLLEFCHPEKPQPKTDTTLEISTAYFQYYSLRPAWTRFKTTISTITGWLWIVEIIQSFTKHILLYVFPAAENQKEFLLCLSLSFNQQIEIWRLVRKRTSPLDVLVEWRITVTREFAVMLVFDKTSS